MSDIKPIIKWAGGKRQLLPKIREMMPTEFNTYYEPFFGGGALFFDLATESSVINDSNTQLIQMYKQIKAHPKAVCDELEDLQTIYNNCRTMTEKDDLYYSLREDYNNCFNSKPLYASALFIFLNKAGYNGLYRVNAAGKYNVPPAHRKTINAYEKDNIYAVSKQLKKARILTGDFEKACEGATKNDFVFFDSPYYDTFDTYQAGGFSEADHVRLFNLFEKLTQKGIYCMLTNNNCDFIKNLYKNYNIKVVDVKRMINSDSSKRTGQEVIITNY